MTSVLPVPLVQNGHIADVHHQVPPPAGADPYDGQCTCGWTGAWPTLPLALAGLRRHVGYDAEAHRRRVHLLHGLHQALTTAAVGGLAPAGASATDAEPAEESPVEQAEQAWAGEQALLDLLTVQQAPPRA